jgi:hypothetical protein
MIDSRYYDREGTPITVLQWFHLVADTEYRRVDWTELGAWRRRRVVPTLCLELAVVPLQRHA